MVREMLGLTGSMAQKPMGLPIKGSKQTMLLGHRPWQSPKHPNNQTPVAQSRKHEVRCHRMSLVRGSMVPLKCSCVCDLTPQGFAKLFQADFTAHLWQETFRCKAIFIPPGDGVCQTIHFAWQMPELQLQVEFPTPVCQDLVRRAREGIHINRLRTGASFL